jgi:Dual oxidase maturation factor
VARHGSGWHVATTTVESSYRAFSTEKVFARVGAYIGLDHVNVTLLGNYPRKKIISLLRRHRDEIYLIYNVHMCLFIRVIVDTERSAYHVPKYLSITHLKIAFVIVAIRAKFGLNDFFFQSISTER